MLPPQTFTGITPERWAAIGAKVKEATGVVIANDAGHAAAHGFELGWSYDAAAAALTVQCLAKPFFVPSGTVQSRISTLVLTA